MKLRVRVGVVYAENARESALYADDTAVKGSRARPDRVSADYRIKAIAPYYLSGAKLLPREIFNILSDNLYTFHL
jgi:hypothetical protein